MKPNAKITGKVSKSIADFRATIISSTIELCKQIDKNKTGDFHLDTDVPIVTTSVKKQKITTQSFLADRVFYWFHNDYYIISNGEDASSMSNNISLDSLVSVYNAVKKAVASY